ncbi:hypothetical protein YC2023_002804 [Brassica napus]
MKNCTCPYSLTVEDRIHFPHKFHNLLDNLTGDHTPNLSLFFPQLSIFENLKELLELLVLLDRLRTKDLGQLRFFKWLTNHNFIFSGKFMASPITIICFEYGGSYIKDGAEIRWILGEDEIHTLVMKTSVEDVTYSELVESICIKIKAYGDGMLKISYFPMVLYSNKPS